MAPAVSQRYDPTPMLVIAVAAGLGVLGASVWQLRARLRALEVRLGELRTLRRELEETRVAFDRGLAVTRAHLADTLRGEVLPPDVVARGLAFRDIASREAEGLLAATPGLKVLDVRTPAEFAGGHIPGAMLIPLDELEDRLGELPARDRPILVTCAAGGRSTQACQLLAEKGFTRLLNLAGGMHGWQGPRERSPGAPPPAPAPGPTPPTVVFRGGEITENAVVGALRQCFDPEIPLNIFDLGLIYGLEIGPEEIAVRMTLTSEACPAARAIPEDVRTRVAALGQSNVRVDVVFDPPWHPSRISPDGRAKLGLTS